MRLLVRRSRVMARGRDRGYATAEMAVALPVLGVVLAMLLWGVAVAVAHVQCLDAARLAARAVARGESVPAAREAALAAAPEGSEVSVSASGGLVRVAVRTRVGPTAGVLASVPGLAVHAVAVTPGEST
ncbi:MAG: TadE family type IV pilus minor pilin [Actinomycetes bacterium]